MEKQVKNCQANQEKYIQTKILKSALKDYPEIKEEIEQVFNKVENELDLKLDERTKNQILLESSHIVKRICNQKQICKNCSKNLASCPNKNKGFVEVLDFDKISALLKIELAPCDVLRSVKRINKNILYSDIEIASFYNSIIESLNIDAIWSENISYQNFKKKIDQVISNYINKGMGSSFILFDSKNCATTIIESALYKFLTENQQLNNLKTLSCLSQKNLSSDLMLFGKDQEVINKFELCRNADILYIKDIESLPINDYNFCNYYFIPLLESRIKNNKLNIVTTSIQPTRFSELFNSKSKETLISLLNEQFKKAKF